MTWTGTRAQHTAKAALSNAGVEAGDEDIALVLQVPVSEARAVIERCLTTVHDPLKLARGFHPRLRQKYDFLMNDELLDVAISRNRVDLPGALGVLESILK